MIEISRLLVFGLIFFVFCNCASKITPPVEFEEIRLHRWTALEGGEIFVLRHVGAEWSAELLSDATRFRCLYGRKVTPKSDWNTLWNTLVQDGLMEISGSEPPSGLEDGDGFRLEVRSGGKIQQYVVENPTHQSSENAKRILRIGDLISKEFDTPMFAAKYDRGQVFDYLYAPCKKE